MVSVCEVSIHHETASVDSNLPAHAAPVSSYDGKRSGKLSFDFHDPNVGSVIDFGAERELLRLPYSVRWVSNDFPFHDTHLTASEAKISRVVVSTMSPVTASFEPDSLALRTRYGP